LGSGWINAVHPDDRAAVMALWKRSVDSQTRFITTYRLRHRDGHYTPMAVVGTVVMEWQAATGWIGSCQDLTEARRNEEALRHSEERLRFLDELGQATRALVDASQIMALTARKLGEYLGADRCAYADVEADGDTFTIRSDWSRAGVASSAGVYSLTLFGPQAVHDLRREVFLVVNDVDRELGDGGGGRMFNAIGIKAIVCAPLVKTGQLVAMMAVHQATPRHWTDREVAIIGEVVDRCWAHIERVRSTALLKDQDRRKDEFLATLAHELRNAAWVDGKRVFVEVNDNGIGIPPEEQGKLFQMFTQLPNTATRSQGGLGIGLSLVKTLATLHGGLVRVHSLGLDQGSTFTVELPLISTREPVNSGVPPDMVESSGRMRVLVVEDNVDGLDALVNLLQLTGYVVRGASDGVAGLEVAQTFAPHVALLDLGLPKMDGLTLAQELRRAPQLAGVKLVALTGWGSTKDKARTQEAGFDLHLTKPIDVGELLKVLSQLQSEMV
jgi:CheY-like chemotaxis protein